MQNELVKIEQLPMAEITTISKTFFESGLFSDTKNAAQAMVRILAGQEIGIPPFAAMSGIHIIQGKPTIGAGLIASRVKGSGKYDYIVKQMDEKACSIDFLQGGKVIGNSIFSIDDARKAGTKNLDKFPKNMLFARAISNGVKWFCPDVFSGPVYVPEEMNQVTEDVPHVEVKEVATVKEMKEDIDMVQVIENLANCHTVDELKLYRDTLDESATKNKVFIKAATMRYNALTEPQPIEA